MYFRTSCPLSLFSNYLQWLCDTCEERTHGEEKGLHASLDSATSQLYDPGKQNLFQHQFPPSKKENRSSNSACLHRIVVRFIWSAWSRCWHMVSPQVSLYPLNKVDLKIKQISMNKDALCVLWKTSPQCMFKALLSHIWSIRPPNWDGWMSGRRGSHLPKHPPSAQFQTALRTLPRAWLRSHHCLHFRPRGFCFSITCPGSWPACRSRPSCGFGPQHAHSCQLGREVKEHRSKERTEHPLPVRKREKSTGWIKDWYCSPCPVLVIEGQGIGSKGHQSIHFSCQNAGNHIQLHQGIHSFILIIQSNVGFLQQLSLIETTFSIFSSIVFITINSNIYNY